MPSLEIQLVRFERGVIYFKTNEITSKQTEIDTYKLKYSHIFSAVIVTQSELI